MSFIAETDHEHVLIVPGAETNVAVERRSRVYTIAAPSVPRSGGYRMLLNLRAVGEVLERERPDIIESADPYQLGWYIARAAKMLRIPPVAFCHSHFCEAHVVPAAARFGRSIAEGAEHACRNYARALYNRFAITFTASEGLAATLRDWGIARVGAVGLGVDTSVFHLADPTGSQRHTIALLYVGRLAMEKNVSVLCDAFAEVNRRRPGRFHVTVIGDGPERARIEQLKSSLSNVTWLKYCADPSELARHYRAADLFVHAGVRETFGLAALESQACGTPVVGIAGTRMDEAILHEQSWWARENTALALADAIERATTHELRSIGAAASRQVHERFSSQKVFERLFCIYREVWTNYRPTSA
jgi:alpha-1,6-mannosyltransferase